MQTHWWRSWLVVGLTTGTLAVCFGEDQMATIRPQAAPGPLANPLKGWCPYTDAGPIVQPYSMVYHYVSWKELEPTPGQYDFESWEHRAWNVPEGRGKHIVFRVYIDYPERPSGLPDWLKDSVKLTPYKEYGGGLSPDYENKALIQGMERLIAALGQRYDRDPRVAFIELGLLGYWGEWHTYPTERLMASNAVEQRVIAAYRAAFPHVGLLARYGRDDAGKQDWLGFHDDMFPEDTDNGEDWSFLAGLRASGRLENWKRASIGGEMVPNAARKWLGKNFAQTMAMTERAHFSWVGPYCPALETSRSPEFLARSQTLVRKLGYQFRWEELHLPTRIERGKVASVTLAGVNEGVAPFARDWEVALVLLADRAEPVARQRLAVDPRTWLPGSIRVDAAPTFEVPPGRYLLALGIIDPMTRGPAVAFANDLPTREGWTILGEVEVIEPAP